MKRIVAVPVFALSAALGACGSLDAKTNSAPALASLEGSVVNPDVLSVSGPVRVAVVWRTSLGSGQQFNVAEDVPVQAVFPAAFTIRFDGPPPADVMNSDAIVSNGQSNPPVASSTSGGSAQAGVDDGGTITTQSLHLLLDTGGASKTGEFAIGTVVAYIDRNGNGKLDLVGPDAGAYIDQVIATNVETSIVYFEGAIPSALVQNARGVPAEGYNLFDAPPCNVPTFSAQAAVDLLGSPPNAACPQMANTDAGTGLSIATTIPTVDCPESSWLPITTPFVLTVATAPEISQVACENGGPSTQPSSSMGSGGPPSPPTVQPAQYPDPCDPNLACAADGSQYFYVTCATMDQGLCLPSSTSCTSVGYTRPTPVPAGWPCIH